MMRPVSQVGVGTVLANGSTVRWARVRPNGYVQLYTRGDVDDVVFVPADAELDVQ